MNSKTWTPSEIRNLARQFADGKKTIATARGQYFRALIETAQAELDGKADQAAQRATVRAVHRRFYTIVEEAIASDEILVAAGVTRKQLGKERNRRTNFARSSHSTIQRWLRAPDHDLTKLNAQQVTKSQLEKDAPAPRKHRLTPERVQARGKRLTDMLITYAKQIAKADEGQAAALLREAVDRLFKQMTANAPTTTDARVAAEQRRPLRVGRTVFVPTDGARRAA